MNDEQYYKNPSKLKQQSACQRLNKFDFIYTQRYTYTHLHLSSNLVSATR